MTDDDGSDILVGAPGARSREDQASALLFAGKCTSSDPESSDGGATTPGGSELADSQLPSPGNDGSDSTIAESSTDTAQSNTATKKSETDRESGTERTDQSHRQDGGSDGPPTERDERQGATDGDTEP